MAKVQETERTYDEERVPKGDYIAFFAGFVPRDRDTMRPQFYEIDKQDWEHGGQSTGEKETRITWLFEVISPAEFKGSEIGGSAAWRGFKVTKNAKGEAVVQVERVGRLLVNMVKWAEACGIDWQAALGDKLPDSGAVSDQMILEALDQALLDCARQGALVVIKANDKGRADTKDQNDTCVMPLGTGPQAKKVEGIEYTVPDLYGAGGAVMGGSWSGADLEALRGHIRDVLHPALTVGEKPLTLAEANERRWLAEAVQAGGTDYAARAATFAQAMAEGGFDAVETNLLVRVVSMVTGAPVAGKIVDTLAPPQLEGAARHLTDLARALGKEVPAAPMAAAPPDEWEGDIPF